MGHTHRYKFDFEKKKTGKESQYMVSHPELGSNPPIGSDLESGCNMTAITNYDEVIAAKIKTCHNNFSSGRFDPWRSSDFDPCRSSNVD